eukprot:gene13667-biopygen13710
MYACSHASNFASSPTTDCRWLMNEYPFSYGTTEKLSSGSTPDSIGRRTVYSWVSPKSSTEFLRAFQPMTALNWKVSSPYMRRRIFRSRNIVNPSFR